MKSYQVINCLFMLFIFGALALTLLRARRGAGGNLPPRKLAGSKESLTIRQAWKAIDLQHYVADRPQGEVHLPRLGFHDYEEYLTAKELANNADFAEQRGAKVYFDLNDVEDLWKGEK